MEDGCGHWAASAGQMGALVDLLAREPASLVGLSGASLVAVPDRQDVLKGAAALRPWTNVPFSLLERLEDRGIAICVRARGKQVS